jgi:protein-disulfide isomerase
MIRSLVLGAAVALTACGGPPPETPAVPATAADATRPTPSPPPPVNDDQPVRTCSGKVPVSQDPHGPPALGPAPAKVTVVVYSDFQCPVCRRITDATYQIAEEWPGEVRVEFRQLALSSHQHAVGAAVAALAAHRQGRFWEMHDLLFANQQALDAGSLEGYAEQLGLDLARFRQDVADPTLRARVEAESQLAAQLGAGATPAFLINGRLGVGWASWMAFRSQVDVERKAADALLAQGTPLAAVHAARARQALTDPDQWKAYQAGVIANQGT